MAVRNAIEIRGLTKRYGSLTAIENLSSTYKCNFLGADNKQ